MVRPVGASSQPSTPAASEGTQSVTVKKGDTLSTIAETHNVSENAMLQANPQIKDGNKLSPGQELRLPDSTPQAGRSGGASPTTSAATPSGPSGAGATSGGTATVSAGRTGGVGAPILQNGSRGAAVRDLQTQVNDWRTHNGRPPITVDGKFGSETTDAVRDFQHANGIKEDGIAGNATRSRLHLENNPSFQRLNDATKTQVRNQMTSYGQDTRKLGNLTQLATTPGFSQLSTAHQQQMLTGLDHHAADSRFAGELSTLADSATFRGLSDANKTSMINNIDTHGGAAAYVKSLSNDQLLTMAEGPDGANQMAALRQSIQSGGIQRGEQAQLDRIGAATFTPGVGLTVNGSAADQATFMHMTRREMLRSPSFRNMMNTANADATHPMTFNVGRNQANTYVDAFNGGGNQTVDLTDMEQWPEDPPAGSPHAMTRGENLVHSLAEARQGALGHGYDFSHRRAIIAENQYRADIGQNSRLRLPPNDTTTGPGNSVIFQFNNGYTEETTRSGGGSTITGINRHNP